MQAYASEQTQYDHSQMKEKVLILFQQPCHWMSTLYKVNNYCSSLGVMNEGKVNRCGTHFQVLCGCSGPQKWQAAEMGSRMNTHEFQTRGCGGKGLIYGSSTSHLTGLKGFAANALVPDTAGHLPKVCRSRSICGSELLWQRVKHQQQRWQGWS